MIRISNGPLEGLNFQLKKTMRFANRWANFKDLELDLCFATTKKSQSIQLRTKSIK